MTKCFVDQDGVIFTVTSSLPGYFKVIDDKKMVQQIGDDGLVIDEYPLWDSLTALALSVESENLTGLVPWLDVSKLTAQRFEAYFYKHEPEAGVFMQRQAALSDFPGFSKDFFKGYHLSESDPQKAEITLAYVVNKGLFQWSVLFNKGSFHEQHEFETYEVGTQEYEQIINLLGIDDPCIEEKVSPVDVIEMKHAIHALLQYVDAIPDDIQLPTMPGVDRDWIESLLSKRIIL